MSRRVAMGKLADGNYGLRLSKPGFDANANPPVPANLIFDSQWPQLLPIHQSGVCSVNGNARTASITFPKLGYIPLFSYMVNAAGGGWIINAEYTSQPYYNSQAVQAPASYLQVWVQDGSFNVNDYPSSNQTWPSYFNIAYVIYKVAG